MRYREVQRFWLNRPLLGLEAGLVALGVALAVSPADMLKGTPDGWTYAALGLPLLLPFVSLKTDVTDDGVVHVGFHPMRRGRRAIAVRHIERAEAVSYHPSVSSVGGGCAWARGVAAPTTSPGNEAFACPWRMARRSWSGPSDLTSLRLRSQRHDSAPLWRRPSDRRGSIPRSVGGGTLALRKLGHHRGHQQADGETDHR